MGTTSSFFGGSSTPLPDIIPIASTQTYTFPHSGTIQLHIIGAGGGSFGPANGEIPGAGDLGILKHPFLNAAWAKGGESTVNSTNTTTDPAGIGAGGRGTQTSSSPRTQAQGGGAFAGGGGNYNGQYNGGAKSKGGNGGIGGGGGGGTNYHQTNTNAGHGGDGGQGIVFVEYTAVT